MKTVKKSSILSSGLMAAFFLICFGYFASIPSNSVLNYIVLFLLAICIITACSVFIYSVRPLLRKEVSAVAESISKIVLLSEANVPKDEFVLTGKTSALIVNGDSAYVSFDNDLSADGCAVINRVENYWYLERTADARSIGLKRAGEQYVYKLRSGKCYKLNADDVVYLKNARLRVV